MRIIFFILFLSSAAFALEPSADMIALAKRSSMTSLAQKIFYQAEPELMEKIAFTESCNKHEGSAALGCYTGKKIYLFNIKEPQLEYMISLTAAHEMLHAAYHVLNKKDRERLDKLLLEVENQIKDLDIRDKIEEYRKRDAAILPSEVHSIIGTEIEKLPPELEQHYSKYFLDRKALVALSQKYYKGLQARKEALKNTDTKLDTLKKNIELQGKILRTKQNHLAVLKRELEEGATKERVETFNKLAEQFNAELKAYQDMISKYNHLAKIRNSKAQQNKELYQALDSKI